jgi:hypothetical protein
VRKNPMATGTKAIGTPSQGNGKPYAKLPANNQGTFPVSLGSGQHQSKFGSGVTPSTAQGGTSQSKGSKANVPTSNTTDKNVKLGHTKHGVGEVPSYLRNS